MNRENETESEINLTPLLDVIFIFLFIVTLSYAQQAALIKQESEASLAQAQEEMNQLRDQIRVLEDAEYDDLVLRNSYEERLQQYEELNRIVNQVTIFCTYNLSNYSQRTIRVLVPGLEYDPIDITPANEDAAFAQLHEILDAYIRQQREANVSEPQADETSGQSFIILSLSLEQIQRGDREQIDAIAEELMEQYEDVYYRKYK